MTVNWFQFMKIYRWKFSCCWIGWVVSLFVMWIGEGWKGRSIYAYPIHRKVLLWWRFRWFCKIELLSMIFCMGWKTVDESGDNTKFSPSVSPKVRNTIARLRYFRELQMAATVSWYCVSGMRPPSITASLLPSTTATTL